MSLSTRRSRLSAVALALTLAGAPRPAPDARAEPVVDRVEAVVKRGRELLVEVQTTVATRGRVHLAGTVNGAPVDLSRRVRPGRTRKVRFKLRPGRYGQRRPESDIVFDLRCTTEEKDGSSAGSDVTATIPVPAILLPGLGNELAEQNLGTDTLAGFALLLQAARGGVYTTTGKHPDLVVHGYDSLGESLPGLAHGLDRAARKLLRHSIHRRVDLVGYSYGGLVARAWSDGRGAGRVRTMVFLGTPNEGTPLAYLASLLTSGQFDGLLGGITGADQVLALAGLLIDADSQQTLRVMYPAYPWVNGLFGGATNPVADEAPLVGMNSRAPDSRVAYHAIAYSSPPAGGAGLPVGTLETVDALTLAGVFAGGQIDPAALFDGEGDLVVPTRSVLFADLPAWSAVVTAHDLGAGTHFTYTADPAVLALVAAALGD